jgi:hypothetical protein
MGALELVFVIGGAWCALLGLVVALMAVASRAEDRFEARVTKARARQLPVPRVPMR